MNRIIFLVEKNSPSFDEHQSVDFLFEENNQSVDATEYYRTIFYMQVNKWSFIYSIYNNE